MIRWLEIWVSAVVRHAWLVLVALFALTCIFGFIAVDRFKMNSDLGELIQQDADWRENFDQYEAQFPHLVRTLVLVVSGQSVTQVDATARLLSARLKEQVEHFSDVYAPSVEPFLRDHALLYLDAEQLDDVIDKLAEAQPVLGAVTQDPSLRAILDLLRDGVENETPTGFSRLVNLISESGDALLAGADPTIYWGDEFFDTDKVQYRLVIAKGALDFGDTLPNAELVQAARELVRDSNIPAGVEVQITGEIALAHEEIDAALTGVKVAGWVSVLLLLAVLVLGVRSAKIIFGIFLMLFTGVIWTSAYAMLTVGEYNTLSVVFLVMFFGLGVDFAVHFSLRYQEAINTGLGSGKSAVAEAMALTARSVGGAIGICTLTTAIGFLGFWPTDYKGLADLGVISAGGMVVAFTLTFTLLPAWYAVVGKIRPHMTDLPSSDLVVAFLSKQRSMVIGLLVVIGLLCGWVAAGTHFDYSVLALRDNASESMSALRRLQDEGVVTDYSLSILTKDPGATQALELLPEVESVVTLQDLVPVNMQENLYTLEDAQQILWNLLQSPSPTEAQPTTADLELALDRLLGSLTQATKSGAMSPELDQLKDVLIEISAAPAQLLTVWQPAVVGPLQSELDWLQRALTVDAFAFEDLPQVLQRNMRSADGWYLAVVNPAHDLSDVSALNRFIQVVREQAPQATGRAVIEWGVGKIVLSSFLTALAIAAVGILLVLFVTFRNFSHALLILIPLTLAVVITLAIGVWFDQPLNMANILVLPLIFGLGVDNGIHVVDRYRGAGDVYHLMHSSTPRAVVLSTLTTIGTFASLMLSPHQGTASIGLLLTVAVSLVLLLTVFVLPVLLGPLLGPQLTPQLGTNRAARDNPA